MADGLTSNVNSDWYGTDVFTDVLEAVFRPVHAR